MRAPKIRTRSWTFSLAIIALLGLVTAASVSAKKKRGGEADDKIQALTVELKELDVADEHHAATSEIGQAEALRDKARSLIGERKQRELLEQTLERAEATVALASAKVVEAEKQAALDAQETQRDATNKELEAVRAAVAKLEKQQATLEKKLRGSK